MTPATTNSGAAARAGIDIHQFYSLDLKGAPAAALADVYAFEGERGIGEPTKYTIRFTHPCHDLSRTEFLNRMGAFVIQPPPASRWSQPEAARRVQGVVTAFALKDSNRDQSLYEIVLESRLALLRNGPKCRFFLDRSIPEIIEQILREHGFDRIQAAFAFTLYRTYAKRPFIMQWGEDDLTFITRLCRRSGIWFVCDTGERCEQVRFCDDFSHYRHDAALTVALRQRNGLETQGAESVQSLEMRATTQPESYAVRTWSPENRVSRPVEASRGIDGDRTTYGEAYTWGTPDLSESDARAEAQLRREAALAAQVHYHGTGDLLDLAPGCVLKFSNRELPDAKYGLLAVRVRCSASRSEPYSIGFDAIPSDRLYRLPLLEETWPRIHGPITGTIGSPDGFTDPFLDDQGRYIVHLHADRDARMPGLQSCPMRLAKPFAGAGQTGFHFGLIPGTVVTVDFLWGCPDLPYISQVLHTAEATDPVNSEGPWSTRNTIRTHTNNTIQLEDRKGREHIKVATESGKTQLNLGSLVDSRQQSRGQGFEVRSDDRGAVRAGGGLFLSADAQTKAGGHAFDMQAAQQQLQAAQSRMKSLSEAVTKARATVAACEAQQELLDTQIRDLQAAVLLASAPHGVAVTTGGHMQLATGGHLFTTTGGNADAAVGGNYTVAAGNGVSLFAGAQDMKLYAASGQVDVQAQGATLNLAALKGVSMTSTSDSITLNAKTALTLVCGGSYIRLSSAGVEIGSPHNITLKGPLRVGPSGTLQKALPMMPQQEPTGMQLFHTYANGHPVGNAPYRVTFADGSWREGRLDAAGRATLANVPRGGGSVAYDEAAGDLSRIASRFTEPAGSATTQGADASGPVLPSLNGIAVAAPTE